MKNPIPKLRYLLYNNILFILGIVFLVISGCRSKKANIKENVSLKNADTINSVFNVNDTIKCIAIYGVVKTVYKVLDIDSTRLEDEYPEFQEREDAVKF